MKLFIGNKNPPFALDVALDGSVLSFSVRSVMQQEFVGDPSKLHTNGGKFFDQALIAEWRGGFGVFGDPIYQRTLDLETLRQHAEFSDHASFMLYAPVGVMERYAQSLRCDPRVEDGCAGLSRIGSSNTSDRAHLGALQVIAF